MFSYGHWVLRLLISHTRQEVRLVTDLSCDISYDTRRRFVTDIEFASCDINHETVDTIRYGQ